MGFGDMLGHGLTVALVTLVVAVLVWAGAARGAVHRQWKEQRASIDARWHIDWCVTVGTAAGCL